MVKTLTLLVALAGLLAAGEDYGERYRPQFHFSPAKNFMNDPNGLVFFQGEYHLFYQHNPFGNEWGHMSWGHAVSPDLVRWQHLPVALAEEGGVMIFSGSAVVDWKNTSGLCRGGEPCLIAVYTGHSREKQTQNLAFSHDRGRTWTKYAGNPVIDIDSREFRDPKVIWHEPSAKWVMAVVLAQERKVRFYGSKDLARWEQLSDFGPAGATGGVWECPDLFELPVDGNRRRKKWVLIVNLNPGGVAGGSGAQYFVGHFDGRVFKSDGAPGQALWADYGKDFYAAQSWSDVPASDGRRLWIAWMSNWEYANKAPTSPWRNAQSLPRSLALKTYPVGVRLVQQPAVELQRLRGLHDQFGGERVAGEKALSTAGETLEILAEFEPGLASEFGLKVRQGAGEETVIGYETATQQLFVDRTKSGEAGFAPSFAGRHAGPLPLEGNRVRLHIFVDRSSVEVFGNDGRTVITDLVFPDPQSTRVALYARGGQARLWSLDLWKLRPAWGK